MNSRIVLAVMILSASSDERAGTQPPHGAILRTAATPTPRRTLLLAIAPETPASLAGVSPIRPGQYVTVPYTLRVYVPPPIDTKIAIEPGQPTRGPLTIEPRLRLVPVR